MEKKLYFAPETVVTDINVENIMQTVSGGDNVPIFISNGQVRELNLPIFYYYPLKLIKIFRKAFVCIQSNDVISYRGLQAARRANKHIAQGNALEKEHQHVSLWKSKRI